MFEKHTVLMALILMIAMLIEVGSPLGLTVSLAILMPDNRKFSAFRSFGRSDSNSGSGSQPPPNGSGSGKSRATARIKSSEPREGAVDDRGVAFRDDVEVGPNVAQQRELHEMLTPRAA